MSSCIATMIKNEHEYLDEWIKYHLSLGVSHIFIFEDLDSDSHKEITDKYENVSLANISTILSFKDLEVVKKLKVTKEYNPQRIYFKRAVRYIKNNFDYKWCFCIDVDEFITLEGNKDLDSTINQYSAYDALLIQWKCYGANGLIDKPDYSRKGVVDTYIRPMRGFIPSRRPDSRSKKIMYNLETFDESFCNDVHQPTDLCNFCNVEFKRDRKSRIFKTIYIRHYITKSWEEYVWKQTIRGYFMGCERSFDTFFEINPELKYLKDELIAKINVCEQE